MNANSLFRWMTTAAVLAAVVWIPLRAAQGAPPPLATVRLPRAVVANGQPLPAGTYALRVSADPVTPVVGQGAGASQWVEFLQAGVVKGRELASVVSPADATLVAKGSLPASGAAKVQLLRGEEYLRVWVNRSGTQYLLHLSLAK